MAAVSPKTPQIPLNSDIHFSPISNTLKSKTLNFSRIIQRHHFSLKKTQEVSVFSTNSTDNKDPNSQICELCLQGNLEEALTHLESLQELQVCVDEDAYIAVLKLCEWRRAANEGSRVYGYVCKNGSNLSLRLGNALLSLFVRLGNLVDACLGYQRLGKAIQGYAMRAEGGMDVSVGNALVQMYSSVGNWEEAEKVFSRIESKDVVSWTSMISAYENNGMPEKAVDTYKMMELEGIRPDEIALASVLSACASLGLLDMGTKLHKFAKRSGLISYVIVANTLVDFYSKCGCMDQALQVFDNIPMPEEEDGCEEFLVSCLAYFIFSGLLASFCTEC
ncbi:hypothetical protein ACET3Z_026663 [Daucus carota]